MVMGIGKSRNSGEFPNQTPWEVPLFLVCWKLRKSNMPDPQGVGTEDTAEEKCILALLTSNYQLIIPFSKLCRCMIGARSSFLPVQHILNFSLYYLL